MAIEFGKGKWYEWPLKGLWGGGDDPYGTVNPEQQQLIGTLGKYFQDYMSQGTPEYSGRLSEGITPMEISNIDRLNALGMQGAGTLSSLQGLANPEEYNKRFQTEIADPSWESWRRNVLPAVQESTPTFHTAQGNITNRSALDMQARLDAMRFQGQESARERALAAVGATTPLAQGAMNIAAIPREIKQAGLDKQYMEFVRRNQDKQNSINQMLEFLGISTKTTEPNYGMEMLLSLVKGLGQAGGAAIMGA